MHRSYLPPYNSHPVLKIHVSSGVDLKNIFFCCVRVMGSGSDHSESKASSAHASPLFPTRVHVAVVLADSSWLLYKAVEKTKRPDTSFVLSVRRHQTTSD